MEEEMLMDAGDRLGEETEEEQEAHDLKANSSIMAGIVTGMVSNELQEILMGLSSKSEDALSNALTRFRRALQSDPGGDILFRYVLDSPKCMELMNGWNAGPKSRASVATLLLTSEVLRHLSGLRTEEFGGHLSEHERSTKLVVQSRLDKFALWIVQNKLSDIYSHLSSGQRSRENGGLRVMSSVVLRGRLLAKQVASKFDFSLDALKKLGKHPMKTKDFPVKSDILKLPPRVAFVEFANSFLVVGDPGLLRWILQKRVLYAGVLHGLASDGDDLLIRMLSILKHKVVHGLIPQGIKVALFGDAALEQLQKITAHEKQTEVVDLAQEILLELSTNPTHGICPGGSSLEDFQKVSGQYGGGAGRLLRLMLKLKAAENDKHKELLLAISKAKPLLAAAYIDSFPYSLEPRCSEVWFSAISLAASLIRISGESNPFGIFFNSAPPSTDSPAVQSSLRRIWPQTLSRTLFSRALLHEQNLVTLSCLTFLIEVLNALQHLLTFIQQASGDNSGFSEDWSKLASYIQDKARMVLPDCQTLLSVHFASKKEEKVGTKRKAGESHNEKNKCVKLDDGKRKLNDQPMEEDIKSLIYARLLDVFSSYQKVLPIALRDINFDPLKFIPEDLHSLTYSQQQALVRLFMSTFANETGSSLYKNTKLIMRLSASFTDLDLRQELSTLLHRCFSSTNAFEGNLYEISIWLHTLPGWRKGSLEDFDGTMATFLCDVVLSVGKNLYKYMEMLHSLLSKHLIIGDYGYEFGPLVVCALDTFMRLAGPEAKSLKIYQKSAISVYLSGVLQSLLYSQVYPQGLAAIITSLLSECKNNTSEWWPLKNLHSHAASFIKEARSSEIKQSDESTRSLQKLIKLYDSVSSSSARSLAFERSLLCVHPVELVESLLDLLEVHGNYTVLASLLGAYPEIVSEYALGSSNIFSESTKTTMFLQNCSFLTLFRAACCNDGILFSYQHVIDVCMELLKDVKTDDVIISTRMILQRIHALQSNVNLKNLESQLNVCFNLLRQLIMDSSHMEQLVKDFFYHPVIKTNFLSEKTKDVSWNVSSVAGFDGMKEMVHSLIDLLTPINRHIIRILEHLVDKGHSKEYAEEIFQRATGIFLEELGEGCSLPADSLVVIFVVGPYTSINPYTLFMGDLVDKVLAESKEASQSTFFYLANVWFQKLSGNTIRDEVMDISVQIFSAVIQMAVGSSLEIGNSCLLMAMQLLSSVKILEAVTPRDVLQYCMHTVNKVKVEVVLQLIRESRFMMEEFGLVLVGKYNFSSLVLCDTTYEHAHTKVESKARTRTRKRRKANKLLENELMLLLPAALYYLEEFEDSSEIVNQVRLIYGELLTKQLTKWDELSHLFSDSSMLERVTRILQLSIKARPLSQEQAQTLLHSLLENPLKSVKGDFPMLVNSLIGKMALVKILVKEYDTLLENALSVLTSTLTTVYKRFINQRDEVNFAYLEEYILSIYCEGTERILPVKKELVRSSVKKMAKTLLRFRFGEAVGMRAIHRVFSKMLESHPHDEYLRNLATQVMGFVMGHSHFVEFLLPRDMSANTSNTLSQLPSILSLLGNQISVQQNTQEEDRRIFIVKLLRVLHAFRLHCKVQMANSRDLLSLLLAAYNASMSSVDQEIFCLMQEIQEANNTLSEMDYLWGNAALERRKEKSQMNTDEEIMQESAGELRRRRFKEDLALDPRKCGLTVLNFPIQRELWSSESGMECTVEEFPSCTEVYDPAFILPFAMHSLAVGCIDMEEFVRVGLLAVSFASMSSANEGLRKLAYELLATFTTHLEECASFKGKSQIHALLMYIKNAITQPWQRLPFVISLFAAESSCILMHPDNPNYVIINRFILRSPSIDLQNIPLFQNMFTSGSPNSRNERAWIFKLLYAGLVCTEDAHIYRKQFVSEILMSFCTSAMSDSYALHWTLQVLRKAVAMPSFVKSLIDNTGLLSWLASVAINNIERQDGILSLEVLEVLLSKKTVESHLISEELITIASTLLPCVTQSRCETFVRPSVNIIKSALRLSHKKNKQTSFTLSWKRISEISQIIEKGNLIDEETNMSILECLLLSPPPPIYTTQDKEILHRICKWSSVILNNQKEISDTFLRWSSAAFIPQLHKQSFTNWWSYFTYLSSKPGVFTGDVPLSRLLITLSTHAEAGIVPTVNCLLTLISGLPKECGDTHWLPKELYAMLEVLLCELPCPDELNPSWRWRSYMARTSKEPDTYKQEVYKFVLILLEQLYVVPPEDIAKLVSKWCLSLSSPVDMEDARFRVLLERLCSSVT